MVLPVVASLLATLAVLLDEALLAATLRLWSVAAGPVVGSDRRRRRGLAARTVALVGGGARRRVREEEEAAAFTSVVELHRLTVVVVLGEDLPGEEERVFPIRRHREQA